MLPPLTILVFVHVLQWRRRPFAGRSPQPQRPQLPLPRRSPLYSGYVLLSAQALQKLDRPVLAEPRQLASRAAKVRNSSQITTRGSKASRWLSVRCCAVGISCCLPQDKPLINKRRLHNPLLGPTLLNLLRYLFDRLLHRFVHHTGYIFPPQRIDSPDGPGEEELASSLGRSHRPTLPVALVTVLVLLDGVVGLRPLPLGIPERRRKKRQY